MAGRPRSIPESEFRFRVEHAAAELFVEKGFDGISVDQIAERCDTSKPSVYRHYGSKSGLYVALIEGFAKRMADAAMTVMETESGSVNRRLRIMVEAWFDLLADDPALWTLLHRAEVSDPEIVAARARITAMQIANDRTLLTTYAPGLPSEQIDPLSHALQGTLVAVGHWWIDGGALRRDVPTAVQAVVRVCEGILATTRHDPATRTRR